MIAPPRLISPEGKIGDPAGRSFRRRIQYGALRNAQCVLGVCYD